MYPNNEIPSELIQYLNITRKTLLQNTYFVNTYLLLYSNFKNEFIQF